MYQAEIERQEREITKLRSELAAAENMQRQMTKSAQKRGAERDEARARVQALVARIDSIFLCPLCGRINPENGGNGDPLQDHTEECPANPAGLGDTFQHQLAEVRKAMLPLRAYTAPVRCKTSSQVQDLLSAIDDLLGDG